MPHSIDISRLMSTNIEGTIDEYGFKTLVSVQANEAYYNQYHQVQNSQLEPNYAIYFNRDGERNSRKFHRQDLLDFLAFHQFTETH